ncbi:lipid A-modifier LpxR family protein [Phenylobacterium sp.]|uniref:lipid A-modifier LpxR family protein n=1 Tax=Phenylobacterium sp. TaxID=1871053 RepID=UPI0026011A42|nr:lipid A-modifier LpxR family protein [Phenylobacterium sp.]
MRWVAFMAIALSCGGACGAGAQSFSPTSSARLLNEAAFAPRNAAITVDPGARFVEHEAYAVGQGPIVWQSAEVLLSGDHEDGPVDSLRVNIGGVLRTPGGLPLNLERGAFKAGDIDVTLVRSWPKAISFDSETFAFDIAPHAGLGLSSRGGQAEGGATLTVSPKSRRAQALAQLRGMGVRDGASYGDAGRWYLFAAASGQAVGLNIMRDDRGWDRAGWSTDSTGALVGDAQIGIGWRKGDVQSSFGVIHREVKGRHMVFGQTTQNDTVAAVTFSIRPGR